MRLHARAHAHAYTHMLHSSHDHMLYCTTAQVKPPGSESVAVLSPQEIEEQLGAKAYSWQSHPIGYPLEQPSQSAAHPVFGQQHHNN